MASGIESMSIKEFYNGKSVFITGGTGFIGKVLIEKLLRSCPGIDKIYVLLRPKKGNDISERLKKIWNLELFETLRKSSPGVFERKVIAIAGDISAVNLGISDEDKKTIIDNVSIVLHIAASVRFHDPLNRNVFMNTRGTRDLIAIAEEIKNLKVFVHVSTAYVNTDRNDVAEEVFPPPADWRKTIKVAENIDEYTLKILTEKYLGLHPNTYVFTKNLAEHLVMEKRGKLPIVIFRPSIVVSSLCDPFAGWVDNFNGPVALSVAVGKGIVHSMYLDDSILLSNVPVDVVCRAIIVASWQRGIKTVTADDDIPVLHCCDAGLKLTIGEFSLIAQDLTIRMPYNNVLWEPSATFTKNLYEHYIKFILMHLLPAIFVDCILKISGRKPMLVKLQRKIYTTNMMTKYFMMNGWHFINKRFVATCDLIPTHEKNDFHYMFDDFNELEYIENSQLGARKFLLNEQHETLDTAKIHVRRMIVIATATRIIIWGLLIWYILRSSAFQMVKIKVLDILV